MCFRIDLFVEDGCLLVGYTLFLVVNKHYLVLFCEGNVVFIVWVADNNHYVNVSGRDLVFYFLLVYCRLIYKLSE